MIINLIRHGQSVLQEQKRYQGFLDSPLSERGRSMLKKADFEPEKVYVSPMLRARETARILFPSARQIAVPDLKEMNFGAFEGKTLAELEGDPAYRQWVDGMCLGRCPGGESKDEYCARVCEAFSKIVIEAGVNGETEAVIVAHGGTQMAVLERFSGIGKEYYKWQLPVGQGYRLLAEDWKRRKQLEILEVRDY